jgi:hypothetical protein
MALVSRSCAAKLAPPTFGLGDWEVVSTSLTLFPFQSVLGTAQCIAWVSPWNGRGKHINGETVLCHFFFDHFPH